MSIIVPVSNGIRHKNLKNNFIMREMILLFIMLILHNCLYAQTSKDIGKLFRDCDNDSTFIEENGLNTFEILELTQSEVEDSFSFAKASIFSSTENSVVGPYQEGEFDVWYKIINVNIGNKYELIDMLLISDKEKKATKLIDKLSEHNDCKKASNDCCNSSKMSKRLVKKCETGWFYANKITPKLETEIQKERSDWFQFKDENGLHVLKVFNTEKEVRSKVDYLKLVRKIKTKYSISFPDEPVRNFENTSMPGIGLTTMEFRSYNDNDGNYLVISFDVSMNISNFSTLDKYGFLEGMMSGLIIDLGLPGEITLNNVEYKNGLVKEYINDLGVGKFIMRGLFIEQSVYLIQCMAQGNNAASFINSFQLNDE